MKDELEKHWSKRLTDLRSDVTQELDLVTDDPAFHALLAESNDHSGMISKLLRKLRSADPGP